MNTDLKNDTNSSIEAEIMFYGSVEETFMHSTKLYSVQATAGYVSSLEMID